MEVKKVAKLLFEYLGVKKITKTKGSFKETVLLKLNSDKAIKQLKWKNNWNMKKSIRETADGIAITLTRMTSDRQ